MDITHTTQTHTHQNQEDCLLHGNWTYNEVIQSQTYLVIVNSMYLPRTVSWENIAELAAFPKQGSNEENYIGMSVRYMENTLEQQDY